MNNQLIPKTKIHSIQEDRMTSYMNKSAIRGMGLLCVSFLFFFILVALISKDIKLLFILMKLMAVPLLLVMSIMYVVLFLSVSIPTNMRYFATANSVGQYLERENINALSTYFINRADRKSGHNRNMLIPFQKVKTINISDTKVVIKAKNYSLWNGNGKIVIPCEVNDYQSIKNYLEAVKKEYNL